MKISTLAKSVLIILLSVTVSRTTASTVITGGTIHNQTWTLSGSPYLIQGNVSATGMFKIEAGVEVLFAGYYRLTVYNEFRAEGTASQPIVFGAADTTGWADDQTTNGGWKGIYVKNDWSADSSIIRHCIIKDTKHNYTAASYAEYAMYCERGITIDGCEFYHHRHASPTGSNTVIKLSAQAGQSTVFKNCFVHDNYAGMFCLYIIGISADTFLLSNNRFHSNQNGSTVYAFKTVMTFENNVLDTNSIGVPGGSTVVLEEGRNTLSGNTIHHNLLFRLGAISTSEGKSVIEKNLICNNIMTSGSCGVTDGGGGIHLLHNSTDPQDSSGHIIRDNIIVNNRTEHYGGGIYAYGCKAQIFNNTLVNNSAFNPGAAIAAFGSGKTLMIKNNVILGNTSDLYGQENAIYFSGPGSYEFDYNLTDLSVLHTVSNTTALTGDTTHCLSGGDPDFTDPTTSASYLENALQKDFDILPASVCINAGINTLPYMSSTDFDMDTRIIAGTVDIGAHESPEGSTGIEENGTDLVRIFPNPASENITIQVANGFKRDVAYIYNATGRLVATTDIWSTATIDISGLSGGLYFIRLKNTKQPGACFIKQ